MSSTSPRMPLSAPPSAVIQTSKPLLSALTLRQLFNQKNLPTEIRSIIHGHPNEGPKVIHITGNLEQDPSLNYEFYILTFRISKTHLNQIKQMITKMGILPTLDLEESLMQNPENIFYISNGEVLFLEFCAINAEGCENAIKTYVPKTPRPFRIIGATNVRKIAVSAGAIVNKTPRPYPNVKINPYGGKFEAAGHILRQFQRLNSLFVVLGEDSDGSENGGKDEEEVIGSILGPQVVETKGEGRVGEVFVNGLQKVMDLGGRAVDNVQCRTYSLVQEEYTLACRARRVIKDGVKGLAGLDTMVVRWG